MVYIPLKYTLILLSKYLSLTKLLSNHQPLNQPSSNAFLQDVLHRHHVHHHHCPYWCGLCSPSTRACCSTCPSHSSGWHWCSLSICTLLISSRVLNAKFLQTVNQFALLTGAFLFALESILSSGMLSLASTLNIEELITFENACFFL